MYMYIYYNIIYACIYRCAVWVHWISIKLEPKNFRIFVFVLRYTPRVYIYLKPDKKPTVFSSSNRLLFYINFEAPQFWASLSIYSTHRLYIYTIKYRIDHLLFCSGPKNIILLIMGESIRLYITLICCHAIYVKNTFFNTVWNAVPFLNTLNTYWIQISYLITKFRIVFDQC